MRTREVGQELLGPLSVIAQTVATADTVVAAAEHDAATSRTELSEQVAHLNCVITRDGLLIVTVAGRELDEQAH